MEWTTAKGTKITLALVTEEPTDADGHKVTTPCYRLECWAGHTLVADPTFVDHPDYGPCLKGGMRTYIPLTIDKVAAVREIIDAYQTEIDRRTAKAEKEDAQYRKMNKDLCPLCHTFCYGDCEA